MHILLIEDDYRLSDYLKETLVHASNSIDLCASRDEVEIYLKTFQEKPRVVILDRMLGRDDAVTLIPKLKSSFPDVGILVLSSLDIPDEKARILDLGADDYVAKPFSLNELLARLRLIARRLEGGKQNVNPIVGEGTVRALGTLCLDLKSQVAREGKNKLDLTRKEFQILSLLMDAPGRVYSKYQILDRVWEIERLTDSNVVETAIKNLRRKLRDVNCTARIESKRNLGYWVES